MNLFIISGPCGSGKSTLVSLLRKDIKVVKTNYKECIGANFCPNSYKSKIDYTLKWFEEIKFQYYNGVDVLISDRSPFDCIAYLKERQEIYHYEVSQQFRKLKKMGVKMTKILLVANNEKLKQRIYNRNRDYMNLNRELNNLEFSIQFYKQNLNQFDYIIDSSNKPIMKILKQISEYLTDVPTTKI